MPIHDPFTHLKVVKMGTSLLTEVTSPYLASHISVSPFPLSYVVMKSLHFVASNRCSFSVCSTSRCPYNSMTPDPRLADAVSRAFMFTFMFTLVSLNI